MKSAMHALVSMNSRCSLYSSGYCAHAPSFHQQRRWTATHFLTNQLSTFTQHAELTAQHTALCRPDRPHASGAPRLLASQALSQVTTISQRARGQHLIHRPVARGRCVHIRIVHSAHGVARPLLGRTRPRTGPMPLHQACSSGVGRAACRAAGGRAGGQRRVGEGHPRCAARRGRRCAVRRRHARRRMRGGAVGHRRGRGRPRRRRQDAAGAAQHVVEDHGDAQQPGQAEEDE